MGLSPCAAWLGLGDSMRIIEWVLGAAITLAALSFPLIGAYALWMGLTS